MVGGPYRAVIFDLDGTLIDSSEDLAGAVNHVRASLGMPALSLQLVRAYIGDGVQVLLTRALSDVNLVPRGMETFKAYYAVHLLDRTRLYAGVPEALAALEGIPLAVVTNKTEAFSRTILERLGILGCFKAIIGSDSGHGRKPNAAPFRAAMVEIGGDLIEPANVLVVGDGRNDVLGARAAGMASCGVGWGIGDAADLREMGPDHWIDRVEELPGLVRSVG